MFRMMKVGTRLTLGFLTIVVLGIIVTSIAIYNMAQMNERAKRLYHQELLGLSYVKEANIDLIYIGRGLRRALVGSNEGTSAPDLAGTDLNPHPLGVPALREPQDARAGPRNNPRAADAHPVAARVLHGGHAQHRDRTRAEALPLPRRLCSEEGLENLVQQTF